MRVFSPAAFPPHDFTALFEELASHGHVIAAVVFGAPEAFFQAHEA